MPHIKWPQGSTLVSFSFSEQILHVSNSALMVEYSSYCSFVT
jgi:hypothetical protein